MSFVAAAGTVVIGVGNVGSRRTKSSPVSTSISGPSYLPPSSITSFRALSRCAYWSPANAVMPRNSSKMHPPINKFMRLMPAVLAVRPPSDFEPPPEVALIGAWVGADEGATVGANTVLVGALDIVGEKDGSDVGADVGADVGFDEGAGTGAAVGDTVNVGALESVGDKVGEYVGK